MIDRQFIDRLKKRDEAAFKKMYEAYIRYVYAIVSRYVANDSYHQDIIQEIFARVFLGMASYEESKGEFKYWLRRLVINQCIEHFRNQNLAFDTVSIDTTPEAFSDWSQQSFDLNREEVQNLLKKMPEGYRQIFMLVVIDEYSHKEVGEMLSISAETSRSQLHRAKKWLKDHMPPNHLRKIVGGL